MCSPLAAIGVAGLVMSAAGTVVQMKSQADYARQQQRTARENYERQRAATDQQNLDNAQRTLTEQSMRSAGQEQQKVLSDIENERQLGLETRGRALQAQGQEGFTGTGFGALQQQAQSRIADAVSAVTPDESGRFFTDKSAPTTVQEAAARGERESTTEQQQAGQRLAAAMAPGMALQAGQWAAGRTSPLLQALGSMSSGSARAYGTEAEAQRGITETLAANTGTPYREPPVLKAQKAYTGSILGDALVGLGSLASSQGGQIAGWFGPSAGAGAGGMAGAQTTPWTSFMG